MVLDMGLKAGIVILEYTRWPKIEVSYLFCTFARKMDPPTEATCYTTNDPAAIKNAILEQGVAIVPLDSIATEHRNAVLDATRFYANVNDMYKDPVDEPTLNEKLNPETFKPRRTPMALSGMVNEYFTPIHMLFEQDENIQRIMDALYGNHCKRAPNRLRITSKFKFVPDSLHIEGKDIFQGNKLVPNADFGCIAAISGTRRFVFWDMKDADATALHEYWNSKGGKNFTSIDPLWMQQHYPGRRRMITVDCSKYMHLIFWTECWPHEIAQSPSLSAFLSPIHDFNRDVIKRVCSYHPPEYLGLTKHDSNLLAVCYNRPGYEWPSGKSAHLIHARAYNFYIDRLKNRYLDSNKKGDLTIQMQLPLHGHINQKTATYRQRLNDRGIKLPDIAFHADTPNFVVDLLELPDSVLIKYGFKQSG